jgi:FkbM family methyltransferase
MDMDEYEKLNPRFAYTLPDGRQMTYRTPNRMTAWRAESLFTKEPDTIEWLLGFTPEDVLVDIGANVGMYSIFAGKARSCSVYAFEPEAQNLALLNANIVDNGLSGRVLAFPIALSDERTISVLHVGVPEPGQSGNSFGEAVDPHLRPRKFAAYQGAISFTLDELVMRQVVRPPSRVKIDVDGLEHKVVKGMAEQIAGKILKSVLVEINSNLAEHRAIVDTFTAAGFQFAPEQVAKARRTEGPNQGIGNYVFTR